MGFLGNMQAQNIQAEKASAYDDMVKANEAKTIYEKGLADSANEFAGLVAMQKMQELQMPMVDSTQGNQMGLQPPMAAGLAQQAIV